MMKVKGLLICLLSVLLLMVSMACGSLQNEPQVTSIPNASTSTQLVETTLETFELSANETINLDLLSPKDLELLDQLGYPDSTSFYSSLPSWYPIRIDQVSLGETEFQDAIGDLTYCFIQSIDDQTVYYDPVNYGNSDSHEQLVSNEDVTIQSLPLSPDAKIWIQGNPPLYYSISKADLVKFIANLPIDDYLMGLVVEQDQVVLVYDVYSP